MVGQELFQPLPTAAEMVAAGARFDLPDHIDFVLGLVRQGKVIVYLHVFVSLQYGSNHHHHHQQ